jgi:hypothetical protein
MQAGMWLVIVIVSAWLFAIRKKREIKSDLVNGKSQQLKFKNCGVWKK